MDQARPLLLQQAVRGSIINIDPKKEEITLKDEQGKTAEYFLPPPQDRVSYENLLQNGQGVVLLYRLDLPLGGKPRNVVMQVLNSDQNVPLFHDDITVAVSTSREPDRVIRVKKREPVVHRFVLYNGPVKVALLKQLTLDHPVDGQQAGASGRG